MKKIHVTQEHFLVNDPTYLWFFYTGAASNFLAIWFHLIAIFWYIPRTFWNTKIKGIMYTSLGSSLLLAIVCLGSYSEFLIRILLPHNESDIVIEIGDCWLYRLPFLGTFVTITSTHVALAIDRFMATNIPNFYRKFGSGLSYAVLTIVGSIGMMIVMFVLQTDDQFELVTHCLSFSATRIGPSFYSLFFFLTYVETFVVSYIGFRLIFVCSRKKGYITSLIKTFKYKEDKSILKQFAPMNIICSSVIILYTTSAILLRQSKDDMSKNDYIMATFYIFIIPHLPFLISFIALIAFYYGSNAHKMQKKEYTQPKLMNTHIYFQNMLMDWDEAYNAKHPGHKENKEQQQMKKTMKGSNSRFKNQIGQSARHGAYVV